MAAPLTAVCLRTAVATIDGDPDTLDATGLEKQLKEGGLFASSIPRELILLHHDRRAQDVHQAAIAADRPVGCAAWSQHVLHV